MKKLIFIILVLLLVGGVVSSKTVEIPKAVAMNTAIIGGGVPSGEEGGCDDCSGNVIMTWHMENSEDVTSGTPCGCSDNDETGTATDTPTYSETASDGTYSYIVNESNEHTAFSGITVSAEFTSCIKMYVSDWSVFTDSTEVFGWYIDADNFLSAYFKGYVATPTVDLVFRFEGQADVEQRQFADVSTSNMTSAWFSVCWSCDLNETAGSQDMWIWVDLDADGVVDAGEFNTNNTINQSEPTGYVGELRIGSGNVYLGGSADYYIDDFYLQHGYMEDIPGGW